MVKAEIADELELAILLLEELLTAFDVDTEELLTALDVDTAELTTELTTELDLLLLTDDATVPHKVPLTLGTPAVPTAWKPKLALALGARVAFQLNEVAV